MNPFVIAGTGRSGTMGMAALLNDAGVRTAFEQFFCARDLPSDAALRYLDFLRDTNSHGEVSSLASPYLSALSGKAVILHQVRNPIATLASLMGQWKITGDGIRWWPNIKFNRLYVPETSSTDAPLEFYIKYWLRWNDLIEPHAIYRYRIEDLDYALFTHILSLIEVTPDSRTERAFKEYKTDVNSGKRDTRVTWRAIPDGQLKYRLLRQAMRYGYTEADLDSYCPEPATCHHCHAEFAPLADSRIVSLQSIPRQHRIGDQITGLSDMYVAAKAWGKVGIEVGCSRGESAEIACNFLDHLYCVDAWGVGFEANEPEFDRRMAAVKNHTKIKLTSEEAAAHWDKGLVDIVYIDAMHDYDNVKKDILAWFSKVKIGGFIAGHDFSSHPDLVGVVSAVTELLGVPAKQFSDGSFLVEKTPELNETLSKLSALANPTDISQCVCS